MPPSSSAEGGSGVDRTDRGVGELAARATASSSAASARRPRASRRAAVLRVPRHAPEHLLIPQRFDRLAAPFRARRPRQLAELALAAERDQRRHGRRRLQRVVPARALDQ